ncbi:uncharacterized protein LAJ45_01788 [Morchella importuna]|uniref:uncharacterized protein n=1 Tax=Morchella importuna TaxID=1174673 RepID=UPI001E8E0C2B|nr:uncharacterized protein LAJ45_01788 [Morchella importuna]KAH8154021.1 hypothetical protein LAJ45_01788 [Morchella importuna]
MKYTAVLLAALLIRQRTSLRLTHQFTSRKPRAGLCRRVAGLRASLPLTTWYLPLLESSSTRTSWAPLEPPCIHETLDSGLWNIYLAFGIGNETYICDENF